MSKALKDASFIGSYPDVLKAPGYNCPEVCFIGKSNVGKSTLINRLTNKRDLAKISSTPGKTKGINLFECKFNVTPRKIILTDLPGFGYAKLSKKEQVFINDLIIGYINNREGLSVVALLHDIRRDPDDDELLIRKVVASRGAPIVIVVTKSDKVTKNELKSRMSCIAKGFNLEVGDLILSGENVPSDNIWRTLLAYL